MTYTEELLCRAESVLAARDLAGLLPYAEALEPLAVSGDCGAFEFFTRLTRELIRTPEQHIPLFARCLDAVCGYDPREGAAFLERMLAFIGGMESAASEPAGILH